MMNKNPRESSHNSRLLLALTASIAVHFIFAWMFTFNDSKQPIAKKKTPPIMDVVLLDESKTSQDITPSNAEAVANKNSSGQQKNAQDNRTRAAKSPSTQQQQKPRKLRPIMPAQPKKDPEPIQKHQKNARILSRKDNQSAALLPPEQQPEEEKKSSSKPVPNIPLANLFPPSSALTQLSRDFDRERRMKQLLSKEADIGINTREAKYAPYARGLVQALEEQWRPATDQLEELAQDDRKVLMRVSIENNGSLGDIRILQPSPSSALNDSAIAAVHAAAPFKPLPSSWGLERANFYFMFEMVEDRFVFRSLNQ